MSATDTKSQASYTKKELTAGRPTWCPGCGDFAVLAMYFKLLEERQIPREKIVGIAGIGCSSRFPYFVNSHGAHFIHGRALPFATGISISRPDLHVFAFGGDGDAFSIGGNHIDHAGRKNIKMTYVIMDNFVYGLTKKQTSPTSPIGFRSKTDPTGAVDYPINPMVKLLAGGATFIARTSAKNPKHMLDMMGQAMNHNGFSVIECLSECVEFYEGAFDKADPRKGGEFKEIPADHDVTRLESAMKYACAPFPGWFGVFYKVNRPTKNELEAEINKKAQEKVAGQTSQQILQATLDRLK